MKKRPLPPILREAMKTLGAIGGESGIGDAKIRKPSHYHTILPEARRRAREARERKQNP